MKYLCKKIATLLIAALLLCGMLTVCVSAHEIPDKDRTGSIVMIMKYNGVTIKEGTMKAYRVGEISTDNNDNYVFIKTAAFAEFNGDITDIQDADLAKKLMNYAEKNHIKPSSTANNVSGKVEFDNLPLGLYLVVQSEPSDGYRLLNPFLVSVPLWEDGKYQYVVSAYGKFEPVPIPTESTELGTLEPSTSAANEDSVPATKTHPTSESATQKTTIPVTGQLNWPIPVFTILGLLIFALGWVLYNKKRDSLEK